QDDIDHGVADGIDRTEAQRLVGKGIDDEDGANDGRREGGAHLLRQGRPEGCHRCLVNASQEPVPPEVRGGGTPEPVLRWRRRRHWSIGPTYARHSRRSTTRL